VHTNFTPAEHANFLAGKITGYATAFLDGRHDVITLGRNSRSAQMEVMAAVDDPAAKAILDPVRLLIVSMMGTAYAQGDERQDRWQQVMGALVELVRHESSELKRTGAQRS
jgi:hypothetical protein